MGVDGGSGNTISLQDLQTFYGGTNPISISEYNRGGSLVPSTTTQSVNATYSGGTKGAGAGGGGYANNPNFESNALSVTFPENTAVSAAVSWSWSATSAGACTLTIGDQTYTNLNNTTQSTSGQSFYLSDTGVAGVLGQLKLYYRVSSGSGLSITGYQVYNGPGSPDTLPDTNSQSLLENSNQITNLYNIALNSSASGSFTISGTTSSSGCTLKIFIGIVINNGLRNGWSPQSLGTRSGTQTIDANTNIPTTFGAGNEGNSVSLDLYNAPGTPAP